MLVSNDQLRIPPQPQARFGLLDINKYLSSQFFDLDIENPLGRGILAKFEPSM
jgi:hypothetical protein